jgi:predicted small lipoprotein YifL
LPTVRAAVAAALLASFALAGCGRKGDPEYPQGTQLETVEKADGSTEKRPVKPQRPFVLDPLLN